MKPGVKLIQYIHASQVEDYGNLPAGSTVNLASVLNGNLQTLPFTQDSADINEQWHYDNNGRYSDFSLSAALRTDKESHRKTLQALAGKKYIFVVTLVSGTRYLIGSREYLPTFTYSDGISGISSNGFSFKISLKSLHGVLLVS